MAAYPDLPLAMNSRRRIINGTVSDMASDGTLWARNFHSQLVYEFTLIHIGMTAAQASTLEAFYTTNKANAITLTYKKDSAQYNCHFPIPPDIDHDKGQWWLAKTVLQGTKA
jgi:hypothetical protein